jgi:hypothetical protein
MQVMMIAVSVTSLAAGVSISYRADAYPRYQKGLQTLAGLLLIAGLAIPGYMMGCLLAHLGLTP